MNALGFLENENFISVVNNARDLYDANTTSESLLALLLDMIAYTMYTVEFLSSSSAA